MKPGDVCVITPRYIGCGNYAHDNGTGDVVRLVRFLAPSDWFVAPLGADDHDWSYICNAARLKETGQ